MIPDHRRQLRFLQLSAATGVLMLLVGLWEWLLSGAIHELVLGGVILLLVFTTWRWWRRAWIADAGGVKNEI